MKIKITFDNKEELFMKSKKNNFKEVCEEICRSNWFCVGNKTYVNVTKIVRIELLDLK